MYIAAASIGAVLGGLFLVGAVVTIGMYILAWYDHVNFCNEADCPGWRRKIRPFFIVLGVAMENLAMFVSLVTYPFRFYLDRLPLRVADDGKYPVLCVHGWGMASHAFIPIRLMLGRMGYRNIFSITVRPVTAPVEVLAGKVANRIDEVLEKTGAEKVTLITHSMGGVLARYALKNLGAAGKVDKVITLGGPHMGSRVAVMCPVGRNTLQFTYKSAMNRELAKDGGLTPGGASYTSIYSMFDNAVLPPDSSDLGPNAKNLLVPWHGHVALLYSPWVLRHIADEMRGA